MARPLIFRLWLVLITLGVASPALSCAVCGLGREGSAATYLMTAVLMSIVPLLMFGGILYYILSATRTRCRGAALEREHVGR